MQNQGNKTNGLAIAGLVLGIVSLVFCWVPFLGIIAGVVGLILSVMGRKNCAPNQAGMATAGLVLSIVGIVLSGVFTTCTMCTICTPWCAEKETVNSLNSLYYY